MTEILRYVAVVAVVSFVASYLLVALIAGFVWLFDRSSRFPRRTVLVIAAVLTVVSIARVVPDLVRDARATHALESAAPALNALYDEAFGSLLAKHVIRERVSELNVDAWPDDAVNVLVPALEFKSVRYGDLHQSMMLGEVVRTPVEVDPTLADEMGERDERIWLPLLEAAAAGGPVRIGSEEVGSVEHSYAMAMAATRTRVLVFGALSDLHGLDIVFSPAHDASMDAFEWLAAVSGQGAEGEIQRLLLALMRVTESESPTTSDVDAAMRAVAAAPSIARSYLTHAWLVERTSLASERVLVDAAVSGGAGVDLTRVNDYRRSLGLPIVLQTDVEEVVATSHMPWWAETVRRASPTAGSAIDDAIASLERRFAPFAGTWSPPEIGLP